MRKSATEKKTQTRQPGGSTQAAQSIDPATSVRQPKIASSPPPGFARQQPEGSAKSVATSKGKNVDLWFDHPNAQAVFVAGTFNHWQPDATPLKHESGDKWVAHLNLQPGTYEYRFVADGQWYDDPAQPSTGRIPSAAIIRYRRSRLHARRDNSRKANWHFNPRATRGGPLDKQPESQRL